MKIEQYFFMTDYSLWEVILNGESPVPTRVIEGVVQPIAPTTAEQRLARKNELKACGNFLMALPDKHQLKFDIHKDAKTLMEEIEKSLKIYEAEVKSSSSASNFTQNIAFVSSQTTDNTNESVSAVASVFAASAKIPVYALPNQIDAGDLEEIDLKWQMAMLTVRARRILQRIGRNLVANRPTSMGFDMSKVECYNCHRKGHFARECRSPKDPRRNVAAEPQRRNVLVETYTSNALVSQCDGVGYEHVVMNCGSARNSSETDESLPTSLIYAKYQSGEGYHDVPPPYTGTFMPPKPDLVFHDAPNVNETVHTAFNVKLSPTKSDKDLSHTHRPSAPIIEDWVSDSEDDSEAELPQNTLSFVQPTKQVKTFRPSIKTVENSIPATNHKTEIPKPKIHGNSRNRKACFVSVLTESKFVPLTAARPVTAAVPHPHVTRPRPAKTVVTKCKTHMKNTINLKIFFYKYELMTRNHA
nr:hypothetical protein [Tanacetum cinerariifolium]